MQIRRLFPAEIAPSIQSDFHGSVQTRKKFVDIFIYHGCHTVILMDTHDSLIVADNRYVLNLRIFIVLASLY